MSQLTTSAPFIPVGRPGRHRRDHRNAREVFRAECLHRTDEGRVQRRHLRHGLALLLLLDRDGREQKGTEVVK